LRGINDNMSFTVIIFFYFNIHHIFLSHLVDVRQRIPSHRTKNSGAKMYNNPPTVTTIYGSGEKKIKPTKYIEEHKREETLQSYPLSYCFLTSLLLRVIHV